MPQNRRSISQSDLDSFTQKLNSWGQSLPENELTLLRVVLAQAASTESSETETEGLTFPSSFGVSISSAVARGFTAAGLPSAAGDWGIEWIRDWTRTGSVDPFENRQ